MQSVDSELHLQDLQTASGVVPPVQPKKSFKLRILGWDQGRCTDG